MLLKEYRYNLYYFDCALIMRYDIMPHFSLQYGSIVQMKVLKHIAKYNKQWYNNYDISCIKRKDSRYGG